MHWNYRIVKHETKVGPSFEVHEVHYNDEREPFCMTTAPIDFVGESEASVIKALTLALQDALKHDVLEVDDPNFEWADPPWSEDDLKAENLLSWDELKQEIDNENQS